MSSNTSLDIWFAGALAAFTVDLLVYPLDTLKTRIQSSSYKRLYKNANSTTSRSLYRGLYQGIGPVIGITIPSSGAFFATYETLKFALEEYIPPNSTLFVPRPLIHSISSAGAELVRCTILTPAEVLKQNAQVVQRDHAQGKRRGSPTLEVFKKFRAHPTRLWWGYTALAARNLPFTALQFPLFERLKEYFLARRKRRKHEATGDEAAQVDGVFEHTRITAMSAGIAGSAAAWIMTPIDVVKTRIMLAAGDEPAKAMVVQSGQSAEARKSIQKAARKSGWLVAREVLRIEGVQGLFRGALIRSVWTAIGSGLYLGIYEGGRVYLENQRNEHDVDEGESLMLKNLKDIKVGIGRSRSQEVVKKSAWQED